MKRVCMAAAVGLSIASTASPASTPAAAAAQTRSFIGQGPWSADRGDWRVEIPFQIFDNVYYVGTDHVSSYLITTPGGLVLIDATSADAVEGLLDNVRRLGFDPAAIEYVFITHPHDDHYGGAARIREVTGATVGMSAADWEFLEQRERRAERPEYQWTTDAAPPRDRVIADGEVVMLGDSAFKFYVTPGHTPGSLSMEYVVSAGGRPYRALTPGGLGFSYGPEWNEAYVASFERLRRIGHWDVVLSNHPFMVPGNLFRRMTALDGADPAGPATHPVVQGQAAIDEWFGALLATAREKAESERAPAVAAGGAPGAGQQTARRVDCLDCGPSGVLADEPQVFHTQEQMFRVVPLKGLRRPWALAFLPTGDMLITEHGGRLRIVRDGVLDPEPLAGMPEVFTPRRKGLMDVALHPRFAQNQFVYFTYHKPSPRHRLAATTVLARGKFEGRGALVEVRDLFVADADYMGAAQTSRILFGPDEKLYMVVGVPARYEVGQAESAQDPADHAGKVLRLNDDGTVPDDNPFVDTPGHRPEIWAFGIRNSNGLAFHPQTGELWETENGPQGGDEVNVIRAGRNYGWPVVSYGRAYSGELTGTHSGPQRVQRQAEGIEDPVFFWSPSISPAGMIFYTGDRFPNWKGDLFVGALRGAELQRLVFNDRGLLVRQQALLRELGQRIRDVQQGPDGLIYLLTDEEDGALLRLEPVETQN